MNEDLTAVAKYMGDSLETIARGGIKRHSEWLIFSSREIKYYMSLLKSRPEWETLAEDAMKQAKVALTEALAVIDHEIVAFSNLPTE